MFGKLAGQQALDLLNLLVAQSALPKQKVGHGHVAALGPGVTGLDEPARIDEIGLKRQSSKKKIAFIVKSSRQEGIVHSPVSQMEASLNVRAGSRNSTLPSRRGL